MLLWWSWLLCLQRIVGHLVLESVQILLSCSSGSLEGLSAEGNVGCGGRDLVILERREDSIGTGLRTTIVIFWLRICVCWSARAEESVPVHRRKVPLRWNLYFPGHWDAKPSAAEKSAMINKRLARYGWKLLWFIGKIRKYFLRFSTQRLVQEGHLSSARSWTWQCIWVPQWSSFGTCEIKMVPNNKCSLTLCSRIGISIESPRKVTDEGVPHLLWRPQDFGDARVVRCLS